MAGGRARKSRSRLSSSFSDGASRLVRARRGALIRTDQGSATRGVRVRPKMQFLMAQAGAATQGGSPATGITWDGGATWDGGTFWS